MIPNQSRSFLSVAFFIVVQSLRIAAVLGAPHEAKSTPYGLQRDGGSVPPGQIVRTTVPAVDRAALAAEDAMKGKDAPYRFAVSFPVSVSPTPKEWEILEDGSALWRHTAAAEAAGSINLGFESFRLPPDVDLFLYTTDGKVVQGPYDSTSSNTGEFWSSVFEGYDEAVVELNARPGVALGDVKLALTSVNSGYRGFMSKLPAPGAHHVRGGGVGSRKLSGTCNIDVICTQGDDWRNEIPAVGVYTIGGSFACTGALVNNVNGDKKPLFLTAYHCAGPQWSRKAASVVVYWDYQGTNCNPNDNNSPSTSLNSLQRTSGKQLLALFKQSDYALILLEQSEFNSAGKSFAGWDARSSIFNAVTIKNSTCIHHPGCDEKAISFDYESPSFSTTRVRVTDWNLGTTEPGSSGSPLFDGTTHRIIGQLYGGYAACGNELHDEYGRFDVSFVNGLKPHLDPSNTGALFVDTHW